MREVALTVRVIAADAMTMSRLGYAAATADCPDLRLVAQAANVAEAAALIAEHLPDVVILDVDLPGLDLAGELRAQYPRLGILMTGPAVDDLVIRSLEAGLSGYLSRSIPVEVLISAVRHAAVVPGSFTSPLMATALARRKHRNVLSPREQEVLHHLNTGESLTSIARRLHLTESTVRTYASRLYDKLNVRSRAEAAKRSGLSVNLEDDHTEEAESRRRDAETP
ncbi:MAG TPA: DNA-binding response regulator [Micromonosporaceae bacterium]|nr:DNA-binding response regulator [Micromonosporaceae bacterium]